MKKTVCAILTIIVVATSFAQKNSDSLTNVYAAGEVAYKQMLDYSRPGQYHQLLADLVGKWTFKGRHFNWVDAVSSTISLEFSGSINRASFAHGRYFVVNIVSDGTLEMPIQDGNMLETKFQGVDIEGYDNVKMKFIRTSIGNHLNSGIIVSEGTYDSTRRTITFDSEYSPVPGITIQDHFLFMFINNDHYKWEYYQRENGKYRKGSEIDFMRIKEQ
ncbi:DUF1579 family protein [Paraflavitalea pollutisoli]|uniref:DUF1579 family protein n=1 Tax=Paraflavitalea pollutisoli TaxID=3034143 RepID=UPI0023EB0186|nr:DUF1579 family protein [Paraflavitalea sp. H1-2-19X]